MKRKEEKKINETKANVRHRPFTQDQKVLFHTPNVQCVRVGVQYKRGRESERENESESKVNRQDTHLCYHSSARNG